MVLAASNFWTLIYSIVLYERWKNITRRKIFCSPAVGRPAIYGSINWPVSQQNIIVHVFYGVTKFSYKKMLHNFHECRHEPPIAHREISFEHLLKLRSRYKVISPVLTINNSVTRTHMYLIEDVDGIITYLGIGLLCSTVPYLS